MKPTIKEVAEEIELSVVAGNQWSQLMEAAKFIDKLYNPVRKSLKELWRDEPSCRAIFREVFPTDELEKITPGAGILKGEMGYTVWIRARGDVRFYLNYDLIEVSVSIFKLVDLIRELGYEPMKV